MITGVGYYLRRQRMLTRLWRAQRGDANLSGSSNEMTDYVLLQDPGIKSRAYDDDTASKRHGGWMESSHPDSK